MYFEARLSASLALCVKCCAQAKLGEQMLVPREMGGEE